MFSPYDKEVPLEERNGDAHDEEEQATGEEEGEVAEGENADDEAMEEETEGDEAPADEEEAVEETDEVTEVTVIASRLESILSPSTS